MYNDNDSTEGGKPMITIDMDTTVYQMIKENPKIKEIMVELGFKDIVKPGLLQSVGRLMSIESGCSMKGIDIEDVKEIFCVNGFELKKYDWESKLVVYQR